MGFLNPLLLWGASLVAVPILIWLISRRWYQRRPWAAMEFLLRALKKHRRRLQLENLLLLLIRVAALLLVAFALARPFFRSISTGPVSKDETENWIFAIDTSASMGFKEGPRSLFDQSRETISDMIQNLVKPRDQVAIATLDAVPRVILAPTPATESGRARLLSALGELSPGARSVDLARSLETIRELAGRFETSGPGGPSLLSKRIVLFSDFQRRDWLGDAGPKDPAVLAIIQETQDAGGNFALGDLKGSDRNLSVVGLGAAPEVIARDVWVQFRATVRNTGREDFEKVELVFSIDGRDEASLILRVGAGETVTSPAVPFRFSEAGYHGVAAEVRTDGLAIDNKRFLAVRVREEAGILLVDGDPAGGGLDRESLYLEAALAPESGTDRRSAEGRIAPYRPTMRSADQLDDLDPREYAVVVLANVAVLPERFLRDLRAFVRDGGALMVFLGRNIDPAYYNQRFAEGGLLPGRLTEAQGGPRESFHLVPGDPTHPLVRYFEERREVTSIFQPIIDFRQFIRCELPADGPPLDGAAPAPEGEKAAAKPPVRVVFRFSDAAASPAVFDSAVGQGRAMWIASTADSEWNDLPKWPDFVAFLYEAIPYLVRSGESRINLALGEPYRQVFDAAEYAPVCVLMGPEASGGISKAMARLEGENRFAITHEDTWIPGLYELRLSRGAAGAAGKADGAGAPGRDTRIFFAVNIDPREGDLRAILPDEMREHFPVLKANVFDAAREIRDMGRARSLERGTETWPALLAAAFALLLLETGLAQFLGRRAR